VIASALIATLTLHVRTPRYRKLAAKSVPLACVVFFGVVQFKSLSLS